MAIVALIPTGKVEHLALGPSLERLFPGHQIVPHPPEGHLNGFTSCDVSKRVGTNVPVSNELDDLAQMLVEALFRRKKGEPTFDFAFVVEDLELVNDHQPQLVTRLFRDAVERYVQTTWRAASAPKAAQVRERCSFHLLRPMVEAYFFGEPNALSRAGAQISASVSSNLDLEQFMTADPAYLALPDRRPHVKNPPARARHPKSYLHYLCDPTLADRQRRYKETQGGANALRVLDWQLVLSAPPRCPFLHALLDDLGDALGAPLSFVDPVRASHLTRLPGPGFPCPANRVLRNL